MSINKLNKSPEPHLNSSEDSFWQSTLWADILSHTGQAEIIPYTSGDVSILIERRKIWRNTTGLYILGIESDRVTPETLKHILDSVTSPTDLFLQIEPIHSHPQEKKHKKAPFRRFLETTTAIIPLTGMTEAGLMYRFEEKGRYNIRVAKRRGLTTHWVSGNEISPYSLPGKKADNTTNTELFFSLLKQTTERNNFSHNSLEYYKNFISVIEKNNSGGLFFATKDNILHTAGIFVYTKKQGIYYYGASPNAPEIRRDHGTYLLQFEAMIEALRRGCSEYDFLGISSKKGDKLTGVTAFKMQFAPERVTLPHETIIVIQPFKLLFLTLIHRVRKWMRQK